MRKDAIWQLVSDNGGMFIPATIRLATVRVPKQPNSPEFETCLYVGNDRDVVESYDTMADAVRGHVKHKQGFGLK